MQDSSQASPELMTDLMKTRVMTGEAHYRMRCNGFRGAVVKLPELRPMLEISDLQFTYKSEISITKPAYDKDAEKFLPLIDEE